MKMLISTQLVVLLAGIVVYGEVAHLGQAPHGVNPTLYDAKQDPIIQLDEDTFNDTVFCHGNLQNCTAFVIEFYSDWCAHCRSYAPLYKALAKDIERWHKVVRVGAMNCADPINEMTCRANGVLFFPFIKYYTRNTTNPLYSAKLKPLASLAEMRDQVTHAILGEYASSKYPDWPLFDFLNDVNTYNELWIGTPPTISSMAIVFERGPSSMIGAQLLLDMSKYSNELIARRCLSNHPLVEALHINDFPSMAVYKRGDRAPILMAELRRMLFAELETFLNKNYTQQALSTGMSHVNHSAISCDMHPEICRTRYFVSELDMLKAIRYALYREVARAGNSLNGANLTALYIFTNALAENFPHTSTLHSTNASEPYQPLKQSEQAIKVFKHMRDFIRTRGLNANLSIAEYQDEFAKAEKENNYPFPIKEDWEHCKGSDSKFRGYTCGLWTTFHALTIQSYKNGLNHSSYEPLSALHAVRGWVDHFFGCRHCRDHFIRMTTKTFPMDSNVRQPDDVFLYLWRAHNIVNARLKGRDTEDPEFLKYQFPAPFLCANCSNQLGQTNVNEVKRFLLDYYTTIMPYRKVQSR